MQLGNPSDPPKQHVHKNFSVYKVLRILEKGCISCQKTKFDGSDIQALARCTKFVTFLEKDCISCKILLLFSNLLPEVMQSQIR